MTYDEYERREKELLNAYKLGWILEECDLEEQLEALHEQWLDELEQP